jgi:uncharacterized protein YggL (DUF469 family)
LIEAVERLGLCFGGGGKKEDFGGFLARSSRDSATEEHRGSIGAFLRADPAVREHDVGPLVDAWHERAPVRPKPPTG